MVQHLFDVEYLTLGLGLIGLGFSVWGLVSALADLNYLTAIGYNGARRIVALNNISRHAFRMAMQAVVIGAGSFAVLHLEYSHDTDTPTLLGFIVIISALTLLSEVIDRFRRVQLEGIHEREARSSHSHRRKTDASIAEICKHDKTAS